MKIKTYNYTDKVKHETELTKTICKILLPLVSPYDLSEESMQNHYMKNLNFHNCVKRLFHLITSEPLTEEKIINDRMLMEKLDFDSGFRD